MRNLGRPILLRLRCAGGVRGTGRNSRHHRTGNPTPGPKTPETDLGQAHSIPGRGAKFILVSPDGPLTGLPFAALPGMQPSTFLIEEGYSSLQFPPPNSCLASRSRSRNLPTCPCYWSVMLSMANLPQQDESATSRVWRCPSIPCCPRLTPSSTTSATASSNDSRRVRTSHFARTRRPRPHSLNRLRSSVTCTSPHMGSSPTSRRSPHSIHTPAPFESRQYRDRSGGCGFSSRTLERSKCSLG